MLPEMLPRVPPSIDPAPARDVMAKVPPIRAELNLFSLSWLTCMILACSVVLFLISSDIGICAVSWLMVVLGLIGPPVLDILAISAVSCALTFNAVSPSCIPSLRPSTIFLPSLLVLLDGDLVSAFCSIATSACSIA